MTGRGTDETQAAQMGADYLRYGCVLNQHGAVGVLDVTALNQHPLYDAFRRLAKQCVRAIQWDQVTGYAVEDGKSILWIDPWRSFAGKTLNSLQGIGPASDPVAAVVWGIEYIVREDTVTYDGTAYDPGDRFTGVQDVSEFTGDGEVHEYDGIRADAPPKGLSNQWLIGAWTHPYTVSTGTFWNPEEYARLYPWMDRCHLDSQELRNPAYTDPYRRSLTRHINPRGGPLLIPESTSAERYTAGTNVTNAYGMSGDQWSSRYHACRVHEPALVIESAIWDGAEIKLTLTDRLHHAEDAPAAIDRDQTTWDITALRAEENYGRTTENAVREYLHSAESGSPCQGNSGNGLRLGDVAADAPGNTTSQILATTLRGACLPTFWFVALPPKVYADPNATADPPDSRLWQKLVFLGEVYARILSERFVDPNATSDLNNCQPTGNDPLTGGPLCSHNAKGVFELTYENAHAQANETQWLELLPGSVRPDGPQGFSPPPATPAYAATFSQLVKVIRLMTRLRVDLPMQLLYRERYWNNIEYRPDSQLNGTCGGDICGGSMVWQGSFPAKGGELTGGFTEWVELDGGNVLTAETTVSLPNIACPGDGTFPVQTYTRDVEWKFALVDEAAQRAIPEHWRALIRSRLKTLFCLAQWQRVHTITGPGSTPCIAAGGATLSCLIEGDPELVDVSCVLDQAGLLSPPTPPESVLWNSGGCYGEASTWWDLTPITFLGKPLYYLDVPCREKADPDPILQPVIVTEPTHELEAWAGSTLAIEVGATGGGTLGYRWLKTGLGAVPAADAATLEFEVAGESDAGEYHVEVSNEGGLTISEWALVTLVGTECLPDLAGGVIIAGDTFECYDLGAITEDLQGGLRFIDSWVFDGLSFAFSQDTMESYPEGEIIGDLTGGTGWSGSWVFDGLAYAFTRDTMESYPEGEITGDLTGGTGWSGSWVFAGLSFSFSRDDMESYPEGEITGDLTGGAGWLGAWVFDEIAVEDSNLLDDSFDTYVVGDNPKVVSLDAGTGWDGPWSAVVFGALTAADSFDAYAEDADPVVTPFSEGTGWTGPWSAIFFGALTADDSFDAYTTGADPAEAAMAAGTGWLGDWSYYDATSGLITDSFDTYSVTDDPATDLNAGRGWDGAWLVVENPLTVAVESFDTYATATDPEVVSLNAGTGWYGAWLVGENLNTVAADSFDTYATDADPEVDTLDAGTGWTGGWIYADIP